MWLLLANLTVNKDIKSKTKFGDNQLHYILRLFDALPNFAFTTSELLCAIITYKHGIYELPHELPNDLGNQKISGECLNFIE